MSQLLTNAAMLPVLTLWSVHRAGAHRARVVGTRTPAPLARLEEEEEEEEQEQEAEEEEEEWKETT